MFTGIIEANGIVQSITPVGSNKTFVFRSPLTAELKVDQSVCHDGICLTVESVQGNVYQVTAIAETLSKTTAANWREGDTINLERSMQLTGRIDGHLVQGHTDSVAECTGVHNKNGSWEFEFTVDPRFAQLMIEKGSITVNGISLTIFNVGVHSFTVAVIPYTYDHTNIRFLKPGSIVNVEFDMIGKYVNRARTLESNFSKPVLDA